MNSGFLLIQILRFSFTFNKLKIPATLRKVTLTLSWRRPLLYRNQSIDLLWFLYGNGLRHERVNHDTIAKHRTCFRLNSCSRLISQWKGWIFWIFLCDALRDLVPFVQFKKREKHQCSSFIFSKVEGWTMGVFHVF